MAAKLRPYHANKGRGNGGENRRRRLFRQELSRSSRCYSRAPHLPHPAVIFRRYELAGVIEPASAEEHRHVNTFNMERYETGPGRGGRALIY